MNHVLISKQEKQAGHLPLTDPRSKHILSVLKISPGRSFRMGILNESCGYALLTSIEYDRICFVYTDEQGPDQSLPITLLIGGTRPPVMQRILRDATAFGVSSFIIVHTQNSEKSYLESRLWKNDAYKQCLYDGLSLAKAVMLPHVQRYFSLKEALELIKNDCRMLADAQSTQHLGQLPYKVPMTLAIGPERGFTPVEINLFQDYGFVGGHLGSRIVRAETATFLALSLVSYQMTINLH